MTVLVAGPISVSELLDELRAGGPAATSGAVVTLVELDDSDWTVGPRMAAGLARPHGLVIGTSRSPLPPESAPLLDALTVTLAPAGPGRAWVDGDLEPLLETVGRAPRAAVALGHVLSVTRQLPDVGAALTVESLAYSALLGGPEFAAWRGRTPVRRAEGTDRRVLAERSGATLSITLNRPERHNAFDAAMREALVDALHVAEVDDGVTAVRLSGAGPSFCSGGDLDEFGSATDLVQAHLVRVERSAGHAVHRLGRSVTAVVHGACIGAGIEIPAFAGRLLARPDAWFQLPELALGLVPGAGGTVSITRRIGAHRTAYLGLTGTRLGIQQALDWGLVDGLA